MDTRLAALAEASARILAARSLEETLRLVTEAAREIVGAHKAVTRLIAGKDGSKALESASPSAEYAAGRGRGEAQEHHLPSRGTLSAPLAARDGAPLGLIELSGKCKGEFDRDDEAVLVGIARLAAAAVETQRLIESAQAAEQRFEAFAKLGNEVLWETDAAHRYTLFLAKGSFRMRRSPQSFLGKTRWEAIAADPADPLWTAHIADLEAHRPIHGFEYLAPLGDGKVHCLRLNAEPQFDAASRFTGYRGTTQDVTELHEAEASARASEERFRQFAGIASDWLWETDAAHRFTFFAGASGTLTHRPCGMTRWELAGADLDDPQWKAHRADMAAGRAFRNFEYTRTDESGRTRYVSVSGEPVRDAEGKLLGYRGTATDHTAQREAEAEAREAAAQYRDIVETANEGVWILDREARTVFTNRRMAEMLGYTPQELVGRSVYEFRPPLDANEQEKRWSERKAGVAEQRELALIRRDGSTFWALINAQPMHDAAGKFSGSLGMVSDITARKQAEAALIASEDRFRDFAALGSDWIWESDADHRITLLQGPGPVARGFALGKRRWEYGGVDPDAPEWRKHRTDLDQRQPFRKFEYAVVGNDGETRHFSLSGKPVFSADGAFAGYRGTTTDITALREAERKAHASEQRFKDFAYVASDWMWETDASHRFNYFSPSRDMSQPDPSSSALGLTRWDFAGGDLAEPKWRAHRDDLEAHRPFRHFEYQYPRPDGTIGTYVVSGVPIFGEDGAFAGYRGTTSDITARRAAEAAARAADEQFRRIVETANEGIWIVGRDMRIAFANRRVEELLGYEPGELLGRCILDFIPADRHGDVRRQWRERRLGKTDRFEGRHLRKDGSQIWVIISSTPMQDAEGAFAGTITMFVDITARKAAEELASRAKRELEAILASTSDGVATFDNDWRFIYLNPSGERIAKIRAKDVVGRTGFDAFNIDENNVFHRCYVEAKRDGQPVALTAYSQVFQGWQEVRAYPHVDGLTIFFRDVTAERQAQLALAESETKLRAALENNQSILASISDGFVALDNEWRFTFINPAAERMWNRKAEDLLGQTIFDSLHVDPNNPFHTSYLESKRNGEPVALTAYSELFGKWIEVRGYPHAAGYTLFFDDVTEERRAHRALLKSQRKLEAAREMNERIFETSLDLICITDRQGKFLQVNPGACEQFGYPAEELVGQSADKFIDSEGIEATRQAMREARRSRRLHTFENRCRRKDGQWVPMNWSAAWSEREEKYFLIGRDMTERMAAQERLNRSQRLEAIGQLTGGIAHDFNNLLTVIMGNSDTLERGLKDREHLRRRAELSLEAARRAAELTAQLLAFARRQTLAPKAVEANRLVRDMHELVHRALGAEIEVDIVSGPALWLCKVDSTQLETALLNLALNARDAMPGGGRLTITTSNRTIAVGGQGSAAELAAGDYVAIEVADTGIGMTPEILARAFEPFFTTKDVGKGSGLGLAMVYGFVKQSGGHAAIESAPGRGTKVTLYLPRAPESAHAAPSPPGARDGAPLPRGSETILVVEDDAAVRELVTDQLRALGYRVLVAGNGRSARNILFGGERIDLLF
ncbi:MAG TPA: PAS domain S-box protein, partial [Alphaproteobacteria bacterium]